ncbi:MAG: redox-sensing transcriptional repressor Rex [Anaerolineales bacterium]|jgi:redox-sensing transcriptional repressor|nr:redox-sensing transcriptional repressor Rex [Anaerolineales bacterium]HJO32768.1 redox-sensing transcriptional repressor Rex [Anaerolineales bacterium]|tara:strand:- start:52 stop:753 length:702 start_codon:yes stop_codon:yes gene_type:complete
MAPSNIPDIVVGRLPIYLRTLAHIARGGQEVTSSYEMGEHLGISPAQIRKDLSHFGEFGKQGTGYNIEYLREQLRRILGVKQEWDVALIGAGAVGKAILRYDGFRGSGFRITAVFDNDPNKIGCKISQLDVIPAERMTSTIQQMGIRVTMLAIPAENAQRVAERLVEAGVEAILNYAPINVIVPPHVYVQHLDPVVALQHMTYYIAPKPTQALNPIISALDPREIGSDNIVHL